MIKKVGIIGCGKIFPRHLEAIEQNDDFVLSAVCDLNNTIKTRIPQYTDYKGKYRCKVLIFMDKLKHPKYREHFEKITFVENLDFQEVIEK